LNNWKLIVELQGLFWTEKTNRTLIRGWTCVVSRLRTKGVCSSHKPCHPGARGSPYTCPTPSLITSRITQRRLWPTRAYIRVNLLHRQGKFSLPQHFLHTLSQFHYWLERWSANVPVDTFRSTTKTHYRRAKSRNRHTRTFSATVVIQPLSPDRLR